MTIKVHVLAELQTSSSHSLTNSLTFVSGHAFDYKNDLGMLKCRDVGTGYGHDFGMPPLNTNSGFDKCEVNCTWWALPT